MMKNNTHYVTLQKHIIINTISKETYYNKYNFEETYYNKYNFEETYYNKYNFEENK